MWRVIDALRVYVHLVKVTQLLKKNGRTEILVSPRGVTKHQSLDETQKPAYSFPMSPVSAVVKEIMYQNIQST